MFFISIKSAALIIKKDNYTDFKKIIEITMNLKLRSMTVLYL